MSDENIYYKAPWLLALLLMLANVLSFVDRMLLTLLVAPIRAELHISDSQISLLHGLAFALFYAIFGLPLGYLADRFSRPKLMASGIGLWSIMAGLCGLANSFATLFLARIGVAIGEATLSPAAVSLLSQKFPKTLLARALGVFQSGIFIGSAMALLAGGGLLAWLENHANLISQFNFGLSPWRIVFILVGLPGIILAFALLFIKDETRTQNAEKSSINETFKYIATKPLLYAGHIIVFTAITILAYGTISWMPSLLVRVHHITTAQAGINLGLIMLVTGPIAVWTSSYLFDKFVKQNNIKGIIGLIFIAIAILSIAAPLYAKAPTLNSALFYSIFLIFGQSFPYGLASAILALISLPRFRGQITSIYLLISNLIGLTFGPFFVAFATDNIFHSDASIGLSICILPIATTPIALIGLFIFAGKFKKEMDL